MSLLVGDLTDWMNKYADEIGSSDEDDFLESFVVAFRTVDQMEEDKIEAVETSKHHLQAAPLTNDWQKIYDIDRPRDWGYLEISDWDKIMGITDPISDDQEEIAMKQVDQDKYKDPFVQFIETLTKDQLLRVQQHEWRYIFMGRMEKEVKEILDGFDYDVLMHISKVYTQDEIEEFIDNLTVDVMKEFTPDQWRVLFARLVTPKLRPILEITL